MFITNPSSSKVTTSLMDTEDAKKKKRRKARFHFPWVDIVFQCHITNTHHSFSMSTVPGLQEQCPSKILLKLNLLPTKKNIQTFR